MHATAANKVFFDLANIKVTDTRFDTGCESYPIRKISGIRIESERRRTRAGIALVIAGAGAFLGGMLANIPVLIVSGAAFMVGGSMMSLAKVNHTIVLTTRGRDVRAVTNKDAALIEAITLALRQAMASRGN